MSEKTATQVLRGRPVTHDEAAASADRLINSRFGKSNGARASIPARPDDDDIVITDYILEQRSASDPIHSVPAAPPEAPKATEPLPCPWCGSKPIVTQIHAKTAGWIVSCETDACCVSPMTDDFNTREEAIALWNRRS